jgi:hypothetical protein
MVANAWRPFGDKLRPEPNGWDEGWLSVNQPATEAVVEGLRSSGYTWVNLQAGSVANPFKDVEIAKLL